MLHIVTRDNGKGESHTIHLNYQPKMWRDGTNVKMVGDYGEVHTAVFNSRYQAALYIQFTDYTMNQADSDPFAGEMNQCFRSDLWSPNAKNTGWEFIYKYLICKDVADVQELKDYVTKRANERRRNQSSVEIITDGSYSLLFIHYVLRAMEGVGHITINGGRMALTDNIGDL